MRIMGVGLLVGLLLLAPGIASAGIELTGVFGAFIGGGITSEGFSLSRSFDNAPLFGARASWFGPFVGAEVSFVRSNSGISFEEDDLPVTLNADVSYLEVSGILSPMPGPISPFVTAGIGTHSFDFAVEISQFGAIEESVRKSGYNFGAGLRVSFAKVVVRGEIRDHVTKISPDDFDLAAIAEELGFEDEHTIHNVELSFGVGLSF